MRLERLEIRHFTSLQHVVLDLTTLPPGLVAITGENGAGKTTVLESAVAALYRTLPSRDGELVDYATDKDATIDLRLAVDGVGAFRARVNCDGIRRTSEAVLEHQDVPITDGKVSTFDAAVRAQFPSLAVLLASAMATQNKRGNFIGKKPKERKELFADLLALNHLEVMSQTAKEMLGVVDRHRERWKAVQAELVRTTGDERGQQIARELHRLRVEQDAATRDRKAFGVNVTALEAEYADLQSAVTAHVAATERVEALRRDLADRRAEETALARDGDLLESTYQSDLRRVADRIRTARDTVEKKATETIKDLDKRVAANKQLQGQADAIRHAVAALEALDDRERELRTMLEKAHANERNATVASRDLEQKLAVLIGPERDLQAAKNAHNLLAAVPFGAACAEAGCQFVREASTAHVQIPDLERTLAPKPVIIANLAEVSAHLTTLRTTITGLNEQVVGLDHERATHRPMATLAEKLTAAETRIAELKQTRATTTSGLKTRLDELAAEHADAKTDLQTRRTTARTALDQRAVLLKATQERLATELTAAELIVAMTDDGHRHALKVQETLAKARAQWEASGETLAALHVQHGILEGQQRAFAEALERRSAVDKTLTQLDTERVDWLQLQKALGRDGVPVLEMDAAGPRISQLTNTLLMACFGSRFSVELVTQQAKTSGAGMKESFELLVSDNERGGEPREVGDLSGGEQVIVSEALMNAISLYCNERSPMPVRTCWRDETTGALDPANTDRYVQMLRQLQTLGGYHHVFFITQNPAVAAQADAQIHVADGTAEIRLPPFTWEAAA